MTERMSKVVGDENRGETGMLNARLESARFFLPIKALVIRVTVFLLPLTWLHFAVWFSFPKDRAGSLLVDGSLSHPLGPYVPAALWACGMAVPKARHGSGGPGAPQ